MDRVDILSVVTRGADSGSFHDWATLMTGNMVVRLLSPPGGRPIQDFHFGVVTSRVDLPNICSILQPSLENQPGVQPCDGRLLVPRPWLSGQKTDELPPFVSAGIGNDPRELVTAYMAFFDSGPECSLTQFLESAALALDGRNPGFLRPDSLLVILLFADREDCSTKDPSLWKSLWAPKATHDCGPVVGHATSYCCPNSLCYDPPAGLLHPVEGYVKRFAAVAKDGRLLVALVGLDSSPEWDRPSPESGICARAYCRSKLQPTVRLAQLVGKLDALNDPNIEARSYIDCAAFSAGNPTGERIGQQIGDRILEILSR